MHALRLSIVILFAFVHGRSLAADEWYRGLDLERAVAASDLIAVVRVTDVNETAVAHGGKGEAILLQFVFEPVRTLKGVFARKELSLTANDLGGWRYSGALNEIEEGQLRLLLLARTGPGYANRNQAESLAHSAPVLASESDPLIAATSVLISVSQQHDRAQRVAQALAGLRDAKGSAAVVLLKSIESRALLASQTPDAVEAIVARLRDASPAVREQAALTLRAVLDADYFARQPPREEALRGAIAALDRDDHDVASRVATIRLLGVAADASSDRSAARWYDVAAPNDTFAETAARLRTAAELKPSAQRAAALMRFQTLPLDASYETEHAAGLAVVALAPDIAARELRRRYDRTAQAGLDAQAEIVLIGELPQGAVAALADVAKTVRDPVGRTAVMMAAQRIAERDASAALTPIVASMLDPRWPGLRWSATTTLMKIDAVEAAQALRPHLRQEPELLRKLQMAEFLGRHGLRDGYPYALEHMSEPALQDQAVAALAAIREPASIQTLRDVLASSNDERWNAAALRALGALGDRDIAQRCLEIVGNLQHPLAPAALIALGDLGDMSALESVRAALVSRNPAVLEAGVRAAGKFSAAPGVAAADELRTQIAAVLSDANAPLQARHHALAALLARDDSQINDALAVAIFDAGLEGSELLSQVEKLTSSRKLELAQRVASAD